MSFDPKTQAALEYQARRMRFALANGNQHEADIIQRRVDMILDERPSPAGVAADGEVIYDNASPWVLEQLEAVNMTGVPEKVLGLSDIKEQEVVEAAETLLRRKGDDDDGLVPV